MAGTGTFLRPTGRFTMKLILYLAWAASGLVIYILFQLVLIGKSTNLAPGARRDLLLINTFFRAAPEMSQNGAQNGCEMDPGMSQNIAFPEGREASKRFVPLMFSLKMGTRRDPKQEPEMEPGIVPEFAICSYFKKCRSGAWGPPGLITYQHILSGRFRLIAKKWQIWRLGPAGTYYLSTYFPDRIGFIKGLTDLAPGARRDLLLINMFSGAFRLIAKNDRSGAWGPPGLITYRHIFRTDLDLLKNWQIWSLGPAGTYYLSTYFPGGFRLIAKDWQIWRLVPAGTYYLSTYLFGRIRTY